MGDGHPRSGTTVSDPEVVDEADIDFAALEEAAASGSPPRSGETSPSTA